MPIAILPFEPGHLGLVREFNARMRASQASTEFLLSEETAPRSEAKVRSTQYVALDETGTVRGGVILLEHPGWVNGSVQTVLNVQSPLSEGIIDSRFFMLGPQLVKFALSQTPYVFAVGMGNETNPFPRLLKALGWRVRPVPFFFHLLRVSRCLRQLAPIRNTTLKRIGADGAALSGAGWLGMQFLQRQRVPVGQCTAEAMPSWGAVCGEIWESFRERHSFAIIRDLETLPLRNDRRILPFLVRINGRPTGWFSLLISNMRGHRYFGDLRVATLVDSLPLAGQEAAVLAAAVRQAASLDCDLICANQFPSTLQQASRQTGWLPGPSNFLLATSKALTDAMDDTTSYISRRDGDGLVNLLTDEE